MVLVDKLLFYYVLPCVVRVKRQDHIVCGSRLKDGDKLSDAKSSCIDCCLLFMVAVPWDRCKNITFDFMESRKPLVSISTSLSKHFLLLRSFLVTVLPAALRRVTYLRFIHNVM